MANRLALTGLCTVSTVTVPTEVVPNPTLDGKKNITVALRKQLKKIITDALSKALVNYSDSNTYVQGSTFYIGRYFDSTSTTYMPTGYISNFRVVKGQAIYNKSFTPTTTALTG